MIRGKFYYSSGEKNTLMAFAPLTGTSGGRVFSPSLSGITILTAAYTARLFENFSAQAEGSCFIRTDGITQSGNDYPPSSARLLGGELYGALSWAPVSDVMLTLDGGFFFPRRGKMFVKDAPTQWKLGIGLILSL
jgi:hypothetical protein